MKRKELLRRFMLLTLCMILSAGVCVSGASADTEPPVPPAVTVNGLDAGVDACYNADGALCIQLLPVAKAMQYNIEESRVYQDNICRHVIMLTPAAADINAVEATASVLMVAYTDQDDTGAAGMNAVAVSKDQVLLPLKQNMTLVNGDPYMPSEFYVTGMCLDLVMDDATNTLDIRPIAQ